VHLETRATRLHAEYVKLSSNVDTCLRFLCARSDVSKAVAQLTEAAYRLTLVQADAQRFGSARVAVHAGNISLRDALDGNAPAQGHVDRVALRALYRKLRPLAHPDSATNASSTVTLTQLRQAYESESLQLLHLYSLALRAQDADFSLSALEKTASFLQRRLLLLRATQCYGVLCAYMSRGADKAAAELLRLVYIQQHIINSALANAPAESTLEIKEASHV